MPDDLGERMKLYERMCARMPVLPTDRCAIIRIDGKAFHTYTRNMPKPYSAGLHEVMCSTAQYLAENVQGCVLAYTQSDEISLLLDATAPGSQAWFGGKVQKIVSVAASMATAQFNLAAPSAEPALFDARVFSPPDHDLASYFIWRWHDNRRNALSALARAFFSHKQVQGKDRDGLMELLASKGIDINSYPEPFRFGTFVYPVITQGAVEWQHKVTGEWHTAEGVERREWRFRNVSSVRDEEWWSAVIPRRIG